MFHLIYFFALILLTFGLFIMLTSHNYIHKIIGLGIFQSSVLVFYLSLGKIKTGFVPIMQDGITSYTSPLPHVLMLTAIVVGFATLSVALSFIYQIYKHFGTVSEDIFHVIPAEAACVDTKSSLRATVRSVAIQKK